MSRLYRTTRASSDLAEIWAYIARDNPAAADRFYESLEQQFGRISKHPSIGRERRDLKEGLRSLPIGNYMLFYRAIPEGILILRVLHGHRDIPPLFE